MSLYTRNHDVDKLAEKVRKALGSRTKTEAVRAALLMALAQAESKLSFDQRNTEVMAMDDAIGPSNADFDMKELADKMCRNI